VGAIGTPGLGAGGRVLAVVVPGATGGGVAGEPAAAVEPGLGGGGRSEGFFCSSGLLLLLLLSLPSDDDKLNPSFYFGLYPPVNAPFPVTLPKPITPLWSTSQIGGTTCKLPEGSVVSVSKGIAFVGGG
jgi:hypothetical protein